MQSQSLGIPLLTCFDGRSRNLHSPGMLAADEKWVLKVDD